ncbi:MAG: DUF3048 domain-containing protein [Planctomycetes bacterium]|jgi:hypothetical protein|nr:DUF3048 domain-containing protein [Planctomycetota bacterium]
MATDEKNHKTIDNKSDLTKKSFVFWLVMSGLFFIIAVILSYLAYLALAEKNMFLAINKKNQPEDRLVENNASGKENQRRRLIDGVWVESGQEKLYPIAVVIDNHPDARPQSGLAAANLVFEVPVEGATTRFLAFYASNQQISSIGPVRSARPYFLDWVREFSAGFFHCGGSPAALAEIINEDINDINEFYNGHVFWRASNRQAPHNVMTATAKMRDYLSEQDNKNSEYGSWLYQDEGEIASPTAATAGIIIPDFGVKWQYRLETNDYWRYLNGQIHKDTDGAEIKAKNLTVVFTGMKVLDGLLRLEIDTVGEGRAAVCLDGKCFNGNWCKPDETERLRFYQTNGDEVVFNAGTTWVEVVEQDAEVTF